MIETLNFAAGLYRFFNSFFKRKVVVFMHQTDFPGLFQGLFGTCHDIKSSDRSEFWNTTIYLVRSEEMKAQGLRT